MADERGSKDLVLAPGEFAYIADDTKGLVDVCVGPYKMSLANTERPVRFGEKLHRFEPAKLGENELFRIAPEGWYVILKNPAPANKHPTPGTRSSMTELDVGRKINTRGPANFALWPGQMAKVLQGHHIRSNQYLLVRVYDEDAARANWTKAVIKPQTSSSEVGAAAGTAPPGGDDGASAGDRPTVPTAMVAPMPELAMGQQLIIKGTDVSFYIPPTGIEVVPDADGKLVRDAVTLERLEYCVLLDQNGSKRTEQGPAVVFPRPTEIFVTKQNSEGEDVRKFRAIELNDTSGIYVKVTAEYDDAVRKYQVGEELFITGKEQRIYFPRDEHAVIRYGEREIHYATAIPEGEGRYLMDRDSGEIQIVRGPKMLLPDPRHEVIAKRVLDLKLVELLYPSNAEALAYNTQLAQLFNPTDTGAVNASLGGVNAGSMGGSASPMFGGGGAYASAGISANVAFDPGLEVSRLASVGDTAEARGLRSRAARGFGGDAIARKASYTEPRTILLNTRYQGVPTLDVWSGYAIQLVRKSGDRRVVVGPATVLLEYDETAQVMALSRGKPKNADTLLRTVYLCVTANKVSDIVHVETKDFVGVDVKLSYRVNFEGDPKKWFLVDNYVKFMCDHLRSRLRDAVMRIGIEEFYGRSIEVLRDVILGTKADGAVRAANPFTGEAQVQRSDGERPGTLFTENGMRIYDVEVLEVTTQQDVQQMLVKGQRDAIKQTLEIQAAQRQLTYVQTLEDVKRKTAEEAEATGKHADGMRAAKLARELTIALQQADIKMKESEAENARLLADAKALSLQSAEELERDMRAEQARHEVNVKHQQMVLETLKAEVEAVVSKAGAIHPGLIEALNAFGERAMVEKIAEAMAPMSLLTGGKPVVEALGDLLNGTRFAKQLAASPSPNGKTDAQPPRMAPQ